MAGECIVLGLRQPCLVEEEEYLAWRAAAPLSGAHPCATAELELGGLFAERR